MSEEELKNYDSDEDDFYVKDNSNDENVDFANYFDMILD